MILYSDNKKLEDSDMKNLLSLIERPSSNFSTSYNKDIDLSFLLPTYSNLISKAMSFLELEKRSSYYYTLWYQSYDKFSNSHDMHEHFSGDEILSWVHIISAANDKCFYHLINGEKIYHDNQNDGDFFVFPSWSLHGVKQVETDETRVVIAGNISLKHYVGTDISLKYSKYPSSKIIDVISGGIYG